MTQIPLVTLPDSLVHSLTNACIMTTPEPRRIVSVSADGDSLSLELDGPSTLMLTGVLPEIRTTDETRAVEVVADTESSKLLGSTVSTLRGFSGTVLAVWQARRAVEDWDVAPVVTFVLVATENRAHILERCDLTTF